MRAALYEWATAIDPDDSEVDLLQDGTHAIREMVDERRAWDKTAPLSRWALARTQRDSQRCHATVRDQVHVVCRAFPDNLIGRHAVSHVEQVLEWAAFEHDRTASARRRSRDVGADRANLEILSELGWHKQLDTEIRATYCRGVGAYDDKPGCGPTSTPTPWRVLLGFHDLDAFVEHVRRSPATRRLVTEPACRAQLLRRRG